MTGAIRLHLGILIINIWQCLCNKFHLLNRFSDLGGWFIQVCLYELVHKHHCTHTPMTVRICVLSNGQNSTSSPFSAFAIMNMQIQASENMGWGRCKWMVWHAQCDLPKMKRTAVVVSASWFSVFERQLLSGTASRYTLASSATTGAARWQALENPVQSRLSSWAVWGPWATFYLFIQQLNWCHDCWERAHSTLTRLAPPVRLYSPGYESMAVIIQGSIKQSNFICTAQV